MGTANSKSKSTTGQALSSSSSKASAPAPVDTAARARAGSSDPPAPPVALNPFQGSEPPWSALPAIVREQQRDAATTTTTTTGGKTAPADRRLDAVRTELGRIDNGGGASGGLLVADLISIIMSYLSRSTATLYLATTLASDQPVTCWWSGASGVGFDVATATATTATPAAAGVDPSRNVEPFAVWAVYEAYPSPSEARANDAPLAPATDHYYASCLAAGGVVRMNKTKGESYFSYLPTLENQPPRVAFRHPYDTVIVYDRFYGIYRSGVWSVSIQGHNFDKRWNRVPYLRTGIRAICSWQRARVICCLTDTDELAFFDTHFTLALDWDQKYAVLRRYRLYHTPAASAAATAVSLALANALPFERVPLQFAVAGGGHGASDVRLTVVHDTLYVVGCVYTIPDAASEDAKADAPADGNRRGQTRCWSLPLTPELAAPVPSSQFGVWEGELQLHNCTPPPRPLATRTFRNYALVPSHADRQFYAIGGADGSVAAQAVGPPPPTPTLMYDCASDAWHAYDAVTVTGVARSAIAIESDTI